MKTWRGQGQTPPNHGSTPCWGETSPPTVSLEPLIVSLTEFRKTAWSFQKDWKDGSGVKATYCRGPRFNHQSLRCSSQSPCSRGSDASEGP